VTVRGVACRIVWPRLKSSKKLPAFAFVTPLLPHRTIRPEICALKLLAGQDGEKVVEARQADMLVIGPRSRSGPKVKPGFRVEARHRFAQQSMAYSAA